MKPRKSPRKRSKRRNQVEEADHLIRAIIYQRDGHKCCMCGSPKALTPSHVYAKQRYQNIRWLDINLFAACWPCHRFGWHDNPADGMEWFAKTYPERLRLLRDLKETMPKPRLEELIPELRSRLEELTLPAHKSQYMPIPKDSEIPF